VRIAIFSAIRGSILDITRRQNAIFWVSQLAVVFSTVFGVYLASSEGLKSAIEFHVATTTEKKYYTLSALHSEVENNNTLIKEFCDKNLVKDDSGNVNSHRSLRIPELNWFVWVTMIQSSDSLDLPVDILRDVNTYYTKLDSLSGRMENQLEAYRESMKGFRGLGG